MITDELDKIKEENRVLNNNFERLEAMYPDTLGETNNVKSEYEAKLIASFNDYEKVQAENEILNEEVDVLFKLGRSYSNNATKQATEAGKIPKETPVTSKDEEIEIVEEITIDETENLDDLQAWSVHKMRGFKRVNRASIPSQNSPPRSAKFRGPITKQQKEIQQPSDKTTLGAGSRHSVYNRDRSSSSNAQSGGDSSSLVHKGKY